MTKSRQKTPKKEEKTLSESIKQLQKKKKNTSNGSTICLNPTHIPNELNLTHIPNELNLTHIPNGSTATCKTN